MAGLKVGKHIPIQKTFEIGGEDVDLTFHVLPPDKKMADEISKYRDKPTEELEKALEEIFQPARLFPYIGKWENVLDPDGVEWPLTAEHFAILCETYPTVHGGIVECLYEAAPKKREMDRKNSKTSPGGTSQMGEGESDTGTAETTAQEGQQQSAATKH